MKNAFIGYSYQKTIAFLFLAKMDIERKIQKIIIEADVEHQFDDMIIFDNQKKISCQLKDFVDINFNELSLKDTYVSIRGKKQTFDSEINILFFKNIKLKINSSIFGFPAYQQKNIYIISLSREEAWNQIESLYTNNLGRIPQLQRLFDKKLDSRNLEFLNNELPNIEMFSTDLIDKTIRLGDFNIGEASIVLIEGKPGVGKSHLVNYIETSADDILYRFWISNQDSNYKIRLDFNNFLFELNKILFNDLVVRTKEEIILQLEKKKRLLIIDGLDHVENYNEIHLNNFFDFINYGFKNVRVLIFSRPLKKEINWEKIYINNWNKTQVGQYLKELMKIDDYGIILDIYNLTSGYPIIVNYLAKHYKKYKILPDCEKILEINDYYNQLIKNVDTKTALSVFLSTKSFLMKSEILNLLDNKYLSTILEDFISNYPYLFEIRINRIALIHDSFNTYLRTLNPNVDNLLEDIYEKVFQSIMNEELRFQSRFSFFNIEINQKKEIIKKFSDIKVFKRILEKSIDIEAIQDFYTQIRQQLIIIEPNELITTNYYDLVLIISILTREHLKTLNQFLYTYVKNLILNGYTEEDITSSRHLFGIFSHIVDGNIEHILKVTDEDNFGIENFYSDFSYDINEEDNYYWHLDRCLNFNDFVRKFISGEIYSNNMEHLTEILVNLYIHKTDISEFKIFRKCIKAFIDENNYEKALYILTPFLEKAKMKNMLRTVLNNVKNKLFTLNFLQNNNDYTTLSLKELVLKYKHLGSFELREHIHNYLRLSLHLKRKIDIESISMFFSMYTKRKDYTVVNLGDALLTFEHLKFISPQESLALIIEAQLMSEKGIRHILDYYLYYSDSSIINLLLKSYNLEDLQINWLELPKSHIEQIEEWIFKPLMLNEFRYSYIYNSIDYDDIKDIFETKYLSNLLYFLIIKNKTIEISKGDSIESFLKKNNIQIKYKDSTTLDKEEYWNKRIILDDNAFLINKKQINHADLALYTDGYYNALADIELFKDYNPSDIKNDINIILFNALIARIENINYFANLHYCVGNIPKFLNRYNCNVNWNNVFFSFKLFLEISLLD